MSCVSTRNSRVNWYQTVSFQTHGLSPEQITEIVFSKTKEEHKSFWTDISRCNIFYQALLFILCLLFNTPLPLWAISSCPVLELLLFL